MIGSNIDWDDHRDLACIPHIERGLHHTITCDIEVGIAVPVRINHLKRARYGTGSLPLPSRVPGSAT